MAFYVTVDESYSMTLQGQQVRVHAELGSLVLVSTREKHLAEKTTSIEEAFWAVRAPFS